MTLEESFTYPQRWIAGSDILLLLAKPSSRTGRSGMKKGVHALAEAGSMGYAVQVGFGKVDFKFI